MPYKIFIDQGHNPMNPNAGAEYDGVREQDITFTVGRRLYALLSVDPRFTAELSRPDPTTQLGTTIQESLQARVQAAKRFGADFSSVCTPTPPRMRRYPAAKLLSTAGKARPTAWRSVF